MHSVVLLCLAALIGVSSAATRGSVLLFPSNKGGDKLGGCDDCMTKATQLKLNPIYMNGIAYNAFAVSASVTFGKSRLCCACMYEVKTDNFTF